MKTPNSDFLKSKVLLITGGTGSFGSAALDYFLRTEIEEIRIFSRDEKKQDDIRNKYNNPRIKFYIGDVRDPLSIRTAIKDSNFVFHAAALKQVPSCEFFPQEALKTNVLGTENVIDASIDFNVERVICLSTDKAVYPINAMGISKALMEKVVIAKSRNSRKTVLALTRYGNVVASRGSVIPLFINQILTKQAITLTDENMTRFIMTLNDALDLVIFALNNAESGDTFVLKSPAASIKTIYEAVTDLMCVPEYPTKNIGTRHGEKLFETLVSKEELFLAKNINDYYKIPSDNRSLNYSQFINDGNTQISKFDDYTSHNTKQLNKEELTLILRSNNIIQNILRKTN